MKLSKVLAPVTLAAAALALSSCSLITTPPVAASTYTPATITVPTPSAAPTVAPTVTPAPVATTAAPSAPAAADDTITAPEAAPVAQAPAPCEEDEPCWDCHTMGNHICGSDLVAPVAAPAAQVKAAPAPAPVAKVATHAPAPVTCESRGLITAEDYSCVSPSFYAPTPAPVSVPCSSLKPGDGGTTQQHNCTGPYATPAPAPTYVDVAVGPGTVIPTPTVAPTGKGCVSTQELHLDGTTPPAYCH